MQDQIPPRRTLDQTGAALFNIRGNQVWVPLFSRTIKIELKELSQKYGTPLNFVVYSSLESDTNLLKHMNLFGLKRNLMRVLYTGYSSLSNSEFDTRCCYI